MPCTIHTDFFEDNCKECRKEYLEMKHFDESVIEKKKYKEFTEERAKKLFEEVMLQYLKSGSPEIDAVAKAKAVVRMQCTIRNLPSWSWL